MSRRTFFVTMTCVVLGLGMLAILVAGLLRYQYGWYKQTWQQPGEARMRNSDAFTSELTDLWNLIETEPQWSAKFTDVQINSFLQESFRQSGLEGRLMPEGISDPRIAFTNERIRLGFRYGSGLFSSVITIDLRVWLVMKEQNVIVLELEGFHAGALPVSARSVLEQVSEVGRSNGTGVYWYRNQKTGHPVALLRFQEDQQRAKWVLQALQIGPGSISISGHAADALPSRTAGAPAGQGLAGN